MPEPTTSVMLKETDGFDDIFGCMTNQKEPAASHDTGGTGRLQNALRSMEELERTNRIAQYFRDPDFPALMGAKAAFE
jgi:hypothetical protein